MRFNEIKLLRYMRKRNKYSLRHTKKFAYKKISNLYPRRKQSVKRTWHDKCENFVDVAAEKKKTLCRFMNFYMVKTEKCDHVCLFSHFTVLVRPTII